MTKKILICGGGGFIGHHLARRLNSSNNYITVVDIKPNNEYCLWSDYCSQYITMDLTSEYTWTYIADYGPYDIIYQLAADMGGAGYIFTKLNDYNIMSNSAQINLHCINWALKWKAKVFYSSSACIYPAYNQIDPSNPNCTEDSAYPADPDSEYGWEKLFSERLYLSAVRNKELDVRIARLHNIFGPEGTWKGGREKAPAAICRKVAEAKDGDIISIWGPGTQTRSFLYIDECLTGIQKLMESDYVDPINIGSEEMISINDLAKMIIAISGKKLNIENVSGPVGVMGRNSDNTLIQQVLKWKPSIPLRTGVQILYEWINSQVVSKL